MPEIRPCTTPAERERALAIYNAVWPWDAITMKEVDSWRSQALDYADFLGDGGAAAMAIMPRRPQVGSGHVHVLPDERNRGIGSALYAAVSAWLAEHDVCELDVRVPEDDAPSLAFAQRRGFREVERNGRLVLELAALEPPPIDAPEGIEIVTWAERPELARGLYEVACESYPDVPGERDALMESYEDWLRHDMQSPGDRADSTFVALAGDEVVGYAKLNFTAAQPAASFHDMTAVKRAWRGRGVAGALKRTQIAWAKANGYGRLQTENELRNEPIRRLNERLGYRQAPGQIVVRGPIAPS